MTPRYRLATAIGVFAAVVAAGPSCAAAMDAPRIGTMLVDMPDRRENDWMLVDMRTGQARKLPRSEANPLRGEGSDQWSASGAAAHALMRISSAGVVEFFDGQTLRRSGGFALSSLPGTRAPKFFGNAHLSPDGRYVLGYWKADIRQEDCELVVFDRQGHVVDHGSPLNYDVFGSRDAIAWLPDGRYVQTAGARIVVRQIGNKKYLVAPLHLPPHANTIGTTMAVSPDGRRLALTLGVPARNRQGVEVGYSLLFVAALDGTGLHELTEPSRTQFEHAVSWTHGSPSWSPDGRWITIAPKGPTGLGALDYGDRCPPVVALRADGAQVAVDGLGDPAAMHVQPGNEVLKSCDSAEWIDW